MPQLNLRVEDFKIMHSPVREKGNLLLEGSGTISQHAPYFEVRLGVRKKIGLTAAMVGVIIAAKVRWEGTTCAVKH